VKIIYYRFALELFIEGQHNLIAKSSRSTESRNHTNTSIGVDFFFQTKIFSPPVTKYCDWEGLSTTHPINLGRFEWHNEAIYDSDESSSKTRTKSKNIKKELPVSVKSIRLRDA